MDKFQYIGLFVDESLKIDLLEMIPLKALEGAKIFLHHCTLLHKSQMDNPNAVKVIEEFKKNKGEYVDVFLTHIGYNDKAIAFRLDLGDIPHCNDNPHITICTYEGGKPVDSNFIDNWKEVPRLKIKLRWDKF